MRAVKAIGDFISKHFGWVVLVMVVAGILSGVYNTQKFNRQVALNQATSPSDLKEQNAASRSTWILTCIDNASGRDEAVSEAGIARCGTLGNQLFPERDWEHVAMINWEKQTLGSSPDEE